MFCHLNYNADKSKLSKYFYENFHRCGHHKTSGSEIKFWLKLFDKTDDVNQIMSDLGIDQMSVIPRFSFQYKNTYLVEHIDIDRIVGININLMEDNPATIHLLDVPYSYEAALIDVGSKVHSVKPVDHDRLIIKFAIREPWEIIYGVLKDKNLIKTLDDDYVSILSSDDIVNVKI